MASYGVNTLKWELSVPSALPIITWIVYLCVLYGPHLFTFTVWSSVGDWLCARLWTGNEARLNVI
jgi:hypothetical protein